MADYAKFDHPSITNFIFHPRRGTGSSNSDSIIDISIPVEDNIQIGARFFLAHDDAPTILFFHGNGEIVDDYSDLAPMYTRLGINFLPVDYRGYGSSTGNPNVSSMMSDSHIIFKYILKWLKENNKTGPFIIMGRSLGSASALEITQNFYDDVDALIIESGFAYIIPLLQLLGINIDSLGINENDGFSNNEKIKEFHKPALIIHAEHDHIIPFSDGQALYNSCPSKEKFFLKIPDANHNTIFAYGIEAYMKAIKDLVEKLNS